MEKTKEEIISKVRKLLALGDSSKGGTENEVNTALEMAHKLMRQHDLSMNEVELKKIENEGALDKAATYRKNCVPWERTLAMAVAALTDTATYRHQKWDGGIQFTMNFIGVGADADLAVAAFDSLNETLRKMGKQSDYRGAEQQSFLLGIASRIYSRAKKMQEDKEEAIIRAKEATMQATPTCEVPRSSGEGESGYSPIDGRNPNSDKTAAPMYHLMVVKNELVEAKQKQLKLKSIRNGRMGGSRWSYEHGKRVGDSVNLNFNKQLE